jgi:cellulose synthase/poly-beta-1,6-N-acetylglucosamine synthase-like glycosyltransferase
MSKLIGEILLKHRFITDLELSHALSLQQRSGGRMGDILIGQDNVSYYALYQAIAEQYGVPFVDLLRKPPEASLLHQAEAETYLRLQAIPWRKENGKVIVAVCDPSLQVLLWIKQRFGSNTSVAITSPFDIQRTVQKLFGTGMERLSRLSLWQQAPQCSAYVMTAPRQRAAIFGMLMLMAAMIVFSPSASLLGVVVACQVVFAVSMLFKYWVFASAAPPMSAPHWTKRLASLDERRLPVYTVLVPMVKEAATLPKLLEALGRLDYPRSKLDIKFVLESDDTETLEALQDLKPGYRYEIIRVPPSHLRTKPRACNYALRFARGEYITVFDADDRPDRLQLKKVVYTFRNSPEDVVCLQARLNYYNTGDSWLTLLFSLEYTMLFHFMLYGLQRLGIPIPLGGTSNHISIERLRALGEWDPYNVTEDADLGTRLAARGFRTAMFDSYTMEEAPNRLVPWIRQRSRWIKGYMQTWLVHMRHPRQLYRALGLRSFLGFQCFVGLSSLTFLIAPLLWTLALAWFVLPEAYQGALTMPVWVERLILANFTLNFLVHWYLALNTARRYRTHRRSITVAAWFYPLYLLLHSVASYKALWQLLIKPHFWEKTQHGLAKEDSLGVEDELLENREIQVDIAPLFKVKGPLSEGISEGSDYESVELIKIRQEA